VTDQVRTRPRDRRASILAAARKRFHQNGYAGTSLEDIAGDLGITAPALYRHFRGKDALYTAALESNLRHLELCVDEASSADEVVRGLARVAVEHPTLGLLWNPERRWRLADPDGAIQRRLAEAADSLGILLGSGASPELGRLLAGAALAVASSTGFYESDLEPEGQAQQLEGALAAVAGFRPAFPLVDLEVSSERAASRPWTTRRSLLLDAGAQLIIRRGGYQAVTIEEIAATAGVSPNTVYSHFGGKAELFVAVIRRAVGWLTASLEQAGAQADSADEALQLAITSSLELNAQHPSWTGRLTDEMSNLPEDDLRSVLAEIDEYLAEWLALCSAIAATLPEEAVRVRMRAALAVIDDRARQAARGRVLASEDVVVLIRLMLTS
jgi:AcrR family transcriptional regulator